MDLHTHALSLQQYEKNSKIISPHHSIRVILLTFIARDKLKICMASRLELFQTEFIRPIGGH